MGLGDTACPPLGSRMLGAPIGASSLRGGSSTSGGRVASGRVMVIEVGLRLTLSGTNGGAPLPLVFAWLLFRAGLAVAALGAGAAWRLDFAARLDAAGLRRVIFETSAPSPRDGDFALVFFSAIEFCTRWFMA